MSIKGYRYTNLDQQELQEITSLEEKLNVNKEEELILLAFNRDK